MYEMAQKAREAMKAKAKSLAAASTQKVDSSDWTPAEPMHADVKTGLRPVSRRAYRAGGKVEGEACETRADRKPRMGRKLGGDVKAWVNAKINRNVKDANQEREGIKHVGAMKKGGRAARASGGMTDLVEDALRSGQEKSSKDSSASGAATERSSGSRNVPGTNIPASKIYTPGQMKRIEQGYKKGGSATRPAPMPKRMQRKTGGRAARPGTNVNIVIASKPTGEAPPMGGVVKPPMDMPLPPPAMPPGLPPGMPAPMPMPPLGGMGAPPPAPGGGMPPRMPPMARKRGGKVYQSYRDMDAGAASGEGRLEKAEIQARKRDARRAGGKVYRSYKDMDAGAGSGEGRLEKSEIQKRKSKE